MGFNACVFVCRNLDCSAPLYKDGSSLSIYLVKSRGNSSHMPVLTNCNEERQGASLYQEAPMSTKLANRKRDD